MQTIDKHRANGRFAAWLSALITIKINKMKITQEIKTKSVTNYVYQKHNQDECSGFCDGYDQAIKDMEALSQAAVSGSVCLTEDAIKKKQRKFDFWCQCIISCRPTEMAWFKVCDVCNKRIRQTDR